MSFSLHFIIRESLEGKAYTLGNDCCSDDVNISGVLAIF